MHAAELGYNINENIEPRYNQSVPHRKQCVSITTINRLMLFRDVVAGGLTTVTATGIKLYLSAVCITVTPISSNDYQTARRHIQEDCTLQNTCSWLILNYKLMSCEAVEFGFGRNSCLRRIWFRKELLPLSSGYM
jgi:hypothetical protein